MIVNPKYGQMSRPSRCSPNIRPGLCLENVLNDWFQLWNMEADFFMIWAAISWYFAGPIITLSGRIAASGYVNILGNQVDPMVQMFFHKNNAVFFFKEDKSLIHTARRVQPWFDVYEASLQHLSWPAQSPDLNIIESMWSIWQSGLRSRVPPAWSLNQPDVLHEQWYSIALRLFRTYMSLFQK